MFNIKVEPWSTVQHPLQKSLSCQLIFVCYWVLKVEKTLSEWWGLSHLPHFSLSELLAASRGAEPVGLTGGCELSMVLKLLAPPDFISLPVRKSDSGK